MLPFTLQPIFGPGGQRDQGQGEDYQHPKNFRSGKRQVSMSVGEVLGMS